MTNLLEYDIYENNITQPNFKGEKTPKKHFFAPWQPWAHFVRAFSHMGLPGLLAWQTWAKILLLKQRKI